MVWSLSIRCASTGAPTGDGARSRGSWQEQEGGTTLMKGRILRMVAVGAILALAASACSREEAGGGAAGGEKKTVKIGVIAPLTGPLSALGLGIKNGVDLAIKQANTKGTVPGYTLVLDAQDDAATPATGANAANKLASDDTLAGVIGTLNSSVAQQVAPVLAKVSVAQISPANT